MKRSSVSVLIPATWFGCCCCYGADHSDGGSGGAGVGGGRGEDDENHHDEEAKLMGCSSNGDDNARSESSYENAAVSVNEESRLVDGGMSRLSPSLAAAAHSSYGATSAGGGQVVATVVVAKQQQQLEPAAGGGNEKDGTPSLVSGNVPTSSGDFLQLMRTEGLKATKHRQHRRVSVHVQMRLPGGGRPGQVVVAKLSRGQYAPSPQTSRKYYPVTAESEVLAGVGGSIGFGVKANREHCLTLVTKDAAGKSKRLGLELETPEQRDSLVRALKDLAKSRKLS